MRRFHILFNLLTSCKPRPHYTHALSTQLEELEELLQHGKDVLASLAAQNEVYTQTHILAYANNIHRDDYVPHRMC
jgi:hypothetical protein